MTATVFPVSRIKKIIKEDQDVEVVSQEAVFLIAKAAEMFLEKLAWEACQTAEGEKRKMVQYRDVVRVAESVDEFFFLEDILPEAPKFAAPLSGGNKKRD
ncbi:DNA-directed DNA polymerase epsilon, subunit C [Blastocladiella emersonii ATCC 22665]|nr:DNA-directed DNA polymerase epsilon, subunit C [Blastocladiella emersonii ATCC 22665]